jgi:hypothetical protein
VVDSLKALDPDGRLEKRTYAAQQKTPLFDHLVGKRERENYEECIGAKKHLVLGVLSHTGPLRSNSFAIGSIG